MAVKIYWNKDRAKKAKGLTAAYIEELVKELEALAEREGMEPLRARLRAAREEAERAALSA